MDDDAAAIDQLIAAGDDHAAFGKLRARLGWPAGKTVQTGDLPRWLGLVAELAKRRGAGQVSELAIAATRDPDSPDQLYDLGYALIDAGAPDIAASILWRCLALVGESEEVVCELVSALESALAYQDALAVLNEHATLRTRSFLCRYLYAFNAAMSGRLDLTREVLPELGPDSPEAEVMAGTVAAMVARADRVTGATSLDDRDLRGWHYVLSGGLLVHQSPYGFDDPMHGRYAWLADSLPRIATGLARLKELVGDLELPCVYAPSGRGHEIVAIAASQKLGIPLAPWPAIGVPAPGLVVVHDLADLDEADAARLVQRKEGQILFAHACPWTQDSPVAPDVTTLLYQTLVAPWGQISELDPQTREVRSSSPDLRTPEAIAAEILGSPGLDDSELEADQPDRWKTLVTAAWPPAPGPRSRLWAGGPVPSNRFS